MLAVKSLLIDIKCIQHELLTFVGQIRTEGAGRVDALAATIISAVQDSLAGFKLFFESLKTDSYVHSNNNKLKAGRKHTTFLLYSNSQHISFRSVILLTPT